MTKSESKYFNTAVLMDKALISILEKKDFQYISVKEICHKAGVNRSTFYLHYETIIDLLEETTEYSTVGGQLPAMFAYYGEKQLDLSGLANRDQMDEVLAMEMDGREADEKIAVVAVT